MTENFRVQSGVTLAELDRLAELEQAKAELAAAESSFAKSVADAAADPSVPALKPAKPKKGGAK